jgi:hypothetical protein
MSAVLMAHEQRDSTTGLCFGQKRIIASESPSPGEAEERRMQASLATYVGKDSRVSTPEVEALGFGNSPRPFVEKAVNPGAATVADITWKSSFIRRPLLIPWTQDSE